MTRGDGINAEILTRIFQEHVKFDLLVAQHVAIRGASLRVFAAWEGGDVIAMTGQSRGSHEKTTQAKLCRATTATT